MGRENLDPLMLLLENANECREARKRQAMAEQVEMLLDSDFSTAEMLGLYYGISQTILTSFPNDLKPIEVETLRKAFEKLAKDIKPCKLSLQ